MPELSLRQAFFTAFSSIAAAAIHRELQFSPIKSMEYLANVIAELPRQMPVAHLSGLQATVMGTYEAVVSALIDMGIMTQCPDGYGTCIPQELPGLSTGGQLVKIVLYQGGRL